MKNPAQTLRAEALWSKNVLKSGAKMEIPGRHTSLIAIAMLVFLTWCTETGVCGNIITASGESTSSLSSGASSIPPGTVITMQNWRGYQSFMPEGMKALFEGKYSWKMPPDVKMQVGPTVINP